MASIEPAVERAMEPVRQIAGELVERSQANEFLTLSTDLEEQLQNLRFQIEQDPSLDTEESAVGAYEKSAQPILQGILGRTRWESTRKALEARGAQALLRGTAAAHSLGFQRETDNAVASIDRAEQALTRSYATSDSEADRLAALRDYEVSVSLGEQRGYLTAQQAEARREAFRPNSAEQRVAALLNAGRFEDALAFLNSEEASSSLNPTEIRILRNAVEAERTRAEAEGLDRTVFFLAKRIREIETPEEAATIQAAVLHLVNQGHADRALPLDSALYERTAEMRKNLRSAARIEFALENRIPLSPEDQDDFDAYYEKVLLPSRGADLSPDELLNAQVELIAQAKLVPSALTSQVQTYASSDNPEYVSRAAAIYARIHEAAPQAPMKLRPPEITLLQNMKRGIDLNEDPAKLLEREREIQRQDPEVVRARRSIYREMERDDPNADWILGQDSVSEIQRIGAWDPSVDEVPSDLAARFSAEVERWYLLDPDLNRARTRSLEAISQTWGASRVDGRPRIEFLPPEKMYPEFNGDSGMLQRQLISDVKLERVDLAQEDLWGKLLVQADLDSQRELPTPGYNVWRLNEDGTVGEQLLMSDGVTPIRWFPTIETVPEVREQADIQEWINKDVKAVEAYLEGTGSLDAISSPWTRQYTLLHRGLGVLSSIPSARKRALRETDLRMKEWDARQKQETARAIQENREFVESLKDIAKRASRSLSARRAAFTVEHPVPFSTALLRERTEKEIQARAQKLEALSKEIGERLRRVQPTPVLEPQYQAQWLGRQRRGEK